MSNAFDKASLVMLPHAYEDGKLYSLKPTDRSGDFTFSRGADTATRVNEQGYIEVVTDLNAPRLDYGGGATCPSLLLEPQRTNIARNDFGFNGFGGCTVASEVTANPFGDTTDVFSATFTSGGGFRLNESPILVSGTTYCMGHFMKFNNSAITISASGASASILSASGNFSFDASGNPSKTGDVYFIEYPNGWYYVYALTNAIADGGTRVNWNESSGSILVYKTQYEAGSYPTSYIPTYGSAQTRPAESCVVNGATSSIGQTEGTMFLDFVYEANGGGFYGSYVANATGFSDFVGWRVPDNKTTLDILIRYNNAYQVLHTVASVFAVGNRYKVALKYSSGDIKVFVNNQEKYSSTATYTTPSVPLSKHTISGNGVGTIDSFQQDTISKVNQSILYPTALSDAECIALTTL